MLFLGSEAAFGQKPVKIRFARGARNATVSGNLRGYNDSRTFLIRVRNGQTLKTERVGGNYITIYIKGPDGVEAGDSDASCNDRREVSPTTAGNYRITVVECRKADPWRGRFRFRIFVR